MLVPPDDIASAADLDHVASLAPNAEITVSLEGAGELKQRTIDRVRRFLQTHIPMRAAAQ